MTPRIVVVGSYVQDLTWRCAAFPRTGETLVGKFATGPGGKGSNQAVAAARAGGATCFVGAVGRDAFAAEARAFYRREKIAARLIAKPAHATGTAAILVNDAGENEIIVALGANAALAPRDVPDALVRHARIVVAQLESNLATTANVLRRARRAGALTLLNPAPMRSDFDRRALRHVDILIPNETEFAALVAHEPSQIARLSPNELHRLCRSLGVPTVIVTLGAKGCFVSQRESHTLIAGHANVRVLDTTGAGDAFVGAFAAGLLAFDGERERAARFANAAAALSVTKPGTAPAMPRRKEIETLLRENPQP